VLVGTPLPTAQFRHERLGKATGLVVFASDALSSVAYATEEILLILIIAGAQALSYSMPIAIGISCLVAIVTTSYRQTIYAYPQGGGAYIVAKDNLGVAPGLVAAAALLIDYVLTVAVSVAAGVAAVTSGAGGVPGSTVVGGRFCGFSSGKPTIWPPRSETTVTHWHVVTGTLDPRTSTAHVLSARTGLDPIFREESIDRPL
jgi:amino acid transporter